MIFASAASPASSKPASALASLSPGPAPSTSIPCPASAPRFLPAPTALSPPAFRTSSISQGDDHRQRVAAHGRGAELEAGRRQAAVSVCLAGMHGLGMRGRLSAECGARGRRGSATCCCYCCCCWWRAVCTTCYVQRSTRIIFLRAPAASRHIKINSELRCRMKRAMFTFTTHTRSQDSTSRHTSRLAALQAYTVTLSGRVRRHAPT